MFILLTVLFLFATALTLAALQVWRRGFRFTWLIAAGGAFLTWSSVLLWQAVMPVRLELPAWEPAGLFADSPLFFADRLVWPYAFSLTTLALAVILTEVVSEDFPNPLSWAGTLTLTGLGLLAVLADNPLTLALAWAAIDLTELIIQLRAVRQPSASERVVTAFASRAVGIGLLLWASMVSQAAGEPLDFQNTLPQAGLYLLAAAGLRLGVLPLHLPLPSESALRRGFGTALRLVSAASSLVLLARIPPASMASGFTPVLFILAAVAGIYGGWMWIRSSDELAGRPFWMIGLASLAVASALRGNPTGAAAWSAALVLAGGALFLSPFSQRWLDRVLLAGVWVLSSLPFSPTAAGWESDAPANWAVWVTWPFFLLTQGFLISGYIRHARQRPAAALTSKPLWAGNVYPAGIALLLLTAVSLGFFGWDGSGRVGAWTFGLIAAALAAALVWLTPRLRILNPARAHWIRPEAGGSRLDAFYRGLWSLYQAFGRLSAGISATLEGEGGVLWTLLMLALFISLLSRTP
ncbi:MAG: hypothetical protein ACOYZ8_01660 [Chloroflexota bacterium]